MSVNLDREDNRTVEAKLADAEAALKGFAETAVKDAAQILNLQVKLAEEVTRASRLQQSYEHARATMDKLRKGVSDTVQEWGSEIDLDDLWDSLREYGIERPVRKYRARLTIEVDVDITSYRGEITHQQVMDGLSLEFDVTSDDDSKLEATDWDYPSYNPFGVESLREID